MKWLDPRIWIALIGAIIVAFISGYLTKARSMRDDHSTLRQQEYRVAEVIARAADHRVIALSATRS